MRPHVSILLGVSLFACLLITGCDESTAPLSDASKATPDERLIGLWQHRHKDCVTYYHVWRLGGKTPEGVMRVMVVGHPNNGAFRVPHQFLAFRSDVGGHSFLNCAFVTEEQLDSIRKEGWKAEVLECYIFLKYRVEDDTLLLWMMDHKAKKKAIQDGKIKSRRCGVGIIRFTDTTENLAQFVAAAGDELYDDQPIVRMERVQ
jgi:hypothetical protein